MEYQTGKPPAQWIDGLKSVGILAAVMCALVPVRTYRHRFIFKSAFSCAAIVLSRFSEPNVLMPAAVAYTVVDTLDYCRPPLYASMSYGIFTLLMWSWCDLAAMGDFIPFLVLCQYSTLAWNLQMILRTDPWLRWMPQIFAQGSRFLALSIFFRIRFVSLVDYVHLHNVENELERMCFLGYAILNVWYFFEIMSSI